MSPQESLDIAPMTVRCSGGTPPQARSVCGSGPAGDLFTESATGDISVRSPFDGSVQYTLQSLYLTAPSVLAAPSYSFAFLNGHAVVASLSPNAPDSRAYQAVVTDYPLATADLVHAACAEAGRNLTQAEWAQFVGPEPYELTCPSLPPTDH